MRLENRKWLEREARAVEEEDGGRHREPQELGLHRRVWGREERGLTAFYRVPLAAVQNTRLGGWWGWWKVRDQMGGFCNHPGKR